MATYKDVIPNKRGWIHELARAEVYPDAEKLLQLNSSLDPQQMVEESTITFLTELRELISENSKIFNGFSENGSKYQPVKIYSIAESAADFMIFRNQIKLAFANVAHGLIQITFSKHQAGMSVDGKSEPQALGEPQELHAHVGAFRNIYWTYQTEKVSPEEVAKFYFAEFVRITRDQSKMQSRGRDRLLLNQIKALLHEKGLEL